MTDLKVLRLTDYESYSLPILAQAVTGNDYFAEEVLVSDIFVDDVRADDDESLNLVPRITTFAQLKDVFKLDIDHSLGYDATPPGELYWTIIGFYIRTGIAAFIPKVLGENGLPLPPPGTFVFAHWPGAPQFPESVNPNYHSNAVGGFTNTEGDIGFGYSGGAVIGEGGGVYSIWVSADPPHGTRFFSDAAIRLGWFGGTDHLTANPVFQAVRKGGTTPPPGGQAELRVFDQAGGVVGSVPLEAGQGSGGRIAVYSEGIEQSYVRLE